MPTSARSSGADAADGRARRAGCLFDALANRFAMRGGYIRNATLRAAFLAADADTEITGVHLECAAQLEYEGMGKIHGGGTGISAVVANTRVMVSNTVIFDTQNYAMNLSNAAGRVSFTTVPDARTQNGSRPIAIACSSGLGLTIASNHLATGSPTRDVPDSGPATDFEGDPRPRGSGFDIGADEAR